MVNRELRGSFVQAYNVASMSSCSSLRVLVIFIFIVVHCAVRPLVVVMIPIVVFVLAAIEEEEASSLK